LDPQIRVFVVSTTLTETAADGTECSLSQGDFLTRVDDAADADKNVKVTVSSSQKDDCAVGSQLSVALDDLQDMYNAFHEQIDDGLKSLAENQGKNGLPTGPAAGGHSVAEGQAQPDLTAQADIDQQNSEADKAEGEVDQAAKSSNSD
jgi:aryl-alcohol dehydrogenase-like predicted oxidoreductase